MVVHLLAHDADALFAQALTAGATATSPMKDHDYGYRQGNLLYPFGHHWVLESMDNLFKVPLMP